MSLLTDGIANPLNVHGMRQLAFLPPHFTVVRNVNRYETSAAEAWINATLDGRFWAGRYYDSAGGYQHAIAFEDPAEATYFTLAGMRFFNN